MPELPAYICSAAFFLIGLTLNFATDSASYLTPAGSFIIIAGVLLGSSRKYELLSEKVKKFTTAQIDSNFEKILSEVSKKPLTDNEKEIFRKTLASEIEKDIDVVISEKKHLFRWHEIFLVCAGTFLNGLGDLLFKLLIEAVN